MDGKSVWTFVATALISVAPVFAADSNEGNEGGASQVSASASTALEGRSILVYWDPYKGDGREKRKVVSILENAGGTVAQTTTTDAATLQSELVGKDAFVVAELLDGDWPDGSDLEMLDARFSAFAPVLSSFLAAGRPVIVNEGDRSISPGIQVINSLGLTSVTGGSASTDSVPLRLDDPADPMLADVSSLSTESGWMGFSTSDPELNPVASRNDELVLASKGVSGGYFAIIGFDYFAYNGDMASVLVNAAAVPEPAALSLLAAGGLVMIRRRRAR